MSKVFYTDGACSGNPGSGGYGICCIENNSLIECYRESCDKTTNNREELKAILKVFELAQTRYKEEEVIIYSDSAYAVNMINNWIYSWSKNCWYNSKNKQVENIDLVKSIYNYLNIDFFNCQVFKTKGHANILENEIADALASNNSIKFTKFISENDINLTFDVFFDK